MASSGVKYFSAFSGIGGFELGFGDDCAGFSEIDKHALDVYRLHFPEHKPYGDITQLKELPDNDVFVGGFPCQAFSSSGNRRGFDDTRGTLFFEIARLLRDKPSRHVVLENVRGLLVHDGGRTFKRCIEVLAELGYIVEWQLLDCADFGLPQSRKRLFIVGHLGTERVQRIFPCEPVPVSAAQWWQVNRSKQPRALNRVVGVAKRTDQTLPKHIEGRQRLFVRDDGIANTFLRAKSPQASMVYDGSVIRRFTPTEAERLFGFPEGWTAHGLSGKLATSHRKNLLGNSVAPVVARTIAGLLK